MSLRRFAGLVTIVLIAPLQGLAADDVPKAIPLWPEGTPGAKGSDPKLDIPKITVYLAPADKASGAAVVICPGGGYGGLAIDHEGKQIAEWLNGIGIAGI